MKLHERGQRPAITTIVLVALFVSLSFNAVSIINLSSHTSANAARNRIVVWHDENSIAWYSLHSSVLHYWVLDRLSRPDQAIWHRVADCSSRALPCVFWQDLASNYAIRKRGVKGING